MTHRTLRRKKDKPTRSPAQIRREERQKTDPARQKEFAQSGLREGATFGGGISQATDQPRVFFDKQGNIQPIELRGAVEKIEGVRAKRKAEQLAAVEPAPAPAVPAPAPVEEQKTFRDPTKLRTFTEEDLNDPNFLQSIVNRITRLGLAPGTQQFEGTELDPLRQQIGQPALTGGQAVIGAEAIGGIGGLGAGIKESLAARQAARQAEKLAKQTENIIAKGKEIQALRASVAKASKTKSLDKTKGFTRLNAEFQRLISESNGINVPANPSTMRKASKVILTLASTAGTATALGLTYLSDLTFAGFIVVQDPAIPLGQNVIGAVNRGDLEQAEQLTQVLESLPDAYEEVKNAPPFLKTFTGLNKVSVPVARAIGANARAATEELRKGLEIGEVNAQQTQFEINSLKNSISILDRNIAISESFLITAEGDRRTRQQEALDVLRNQRAKFIRQLQELI